MPGPLRLLTANVLKERSDPHHLAGLLDRVQPDLVFLQEMGEGAGRVLADRYAHHFLFPSEELEGRGVASLRQAEMGSLPLPWRPGTWARMQLEGKVLLAVGVHMSNAIDFPWWESVRQRRDQVDALFSWVDEQEYDALVVVGDMNSTPVWPLYRRLAGRWRDLAEEVATRHGARTERTWGWRPGWPRMLRIDHVFGGGVEALAVEVHPIRGSDHHAVAIDLALSKDGPRPAP